jgi:hypothetical protein
MDWILGLLSICFFVVWIVEHFERKKLESSVARVHHINQQLLIELKTLTKYSEDMTQDKIRRSLMTIIEENE